MQLFCFCGYQCEMYVREVDRIDTRERERIFCRAFLRTMDPERAGAEAECRDGFALLGRRSVQERLEKLRGDLAGQIRREDAVRRLAQLAFGGANDVMKLALNPRGVDPEQLDLSAVSEFKVTEKGVEIKLVDRVRALAALCELLESSGDSGVEELYQALEDAAGQMRGGWSDE